MREGGRRGSLAPMEQQRTLHIVGGTSRSRAEQASTAFALGCHAEIYSDLAEFLGRPAGGGVIVAGGELLDKGIGRLIERLSGAGVWLPVVAAGESPQVPEIVGAVEEGAFDFLPLPLSHGDLARMFAKLDAVGENHMARRRTIVDAQNRIGALSRRERQVLDWMCEGHSNKLIARVLDISPRTVEIHRANMMDKLGLQHSAEAIRLQFTAGLASTACGAESAAKLEEAPPHVPAAGAARPVRARAPERRAA